VCGEVRHDQQALRPTRDLSPGRGSVGAVLARLGPCGPPASMQAAVGVKTPPTVPPARAQAGGRTHPFVGAALAATWPLRSAGSDAGCCRGRDPSHRAPARAQAVDRAHPLCERPWPRHGRRSPQASIPVAVGVKTPPTEPRPELRRWVGRPPPVGAALAATWQSQSAGFDAGCCRGRDPSHRTLARAQAVGRTHPFVGAALAATRPLRSAGFDAGPLSGSRPLPQSAGPSSRRGSRIPWVWSSDSDWACEPHARQSTAITGNGAASRRTRSLGVVLNTLVTALPSRHRSSPRPRYAGVT